MPHVPAPKPNIGGAKGKNHAACDGCQSQWGYGALNETTTPVCSFHNQSFWIM